MQLRPLQVQNWIWRLNQSSPAQPPSEAAGWPSEIPLSLMSFPGEFCVISGMHWIPLQLGSVLLSLSAALGGRRAPLPQDVQALHRHRTGCTGWKSRHWVPLWVSAPFTALWFHCFYRSTFSPGYCPISCVWQSCVGFREGFVQIKKGLWLLFWSLYVSLWLD